MIWSSDAVVWDTELFARQSTATRFTSDCALIYMPDGEVGQPPTILARGGCQNREMRSVRSQRSAGPANPHNTNRVLMVTCIWVADNRPYFKRPMCPTTLCIFTSGQYGAHDSALHPQMQKKTAAVL